MDGVVVALSGGVDSALLLALSVEALGTARVLAVTGDSASLPRHDLGLARRLAERLGVPHQRLETHEMESEGYQRNGPDRCFYCRDELFSRMAELAGRRGPWQLVYGAIADDRADDRPGMEAARQRGVVAPLLEAGLTKVDVRALAAELGLEVHDRPASACLASRIPTGTPITLGRLARVERAEDGLRGLGFGQTRVRVRHHGEVARIVLDLQGIERLLADPALRASAVEAVRRAGFRHVTLDLEAYGAALARVEQVAQALPEQVAAQHGEEQGGTGE
jgi:uncharacterized protein